MHLGKIVIQKKLIPELIKYSSCGLTVNSLIGVSVIGVL